MMAIVQKIALVLLSITCIIHSTYADERGGLRLELSPIWQSSNQVQIPTPTGTRFDFTSLGKGPLLAFRLDEIRVLYAPLSLTFSGNLRNDVSFQNQTFSSTTSTEGLYRFNSYRLTYRYRLLYSESAALWVGLTGKIRDAEIRLTQGAISASSTNIGFVPLMHVLATYRLSDLLVLYLDADALAAPQGRAEDVSLQLQFRISPQFDFSVGYRTLEGGSDGGGNVYNFTWLHYGVLGLGFHF
jgi:hypothetical protein